MSADDKKEYISTTFPELDKIKDEKLRAQVIDTWIFAMEKGNWQSLDSIPFTLLIPGVKTTLMEHTRRVTQMAIAIAEVRKDLDLDLVIAGGLLHDIGKLVEYTEVNGKIVKSEHGKSVRHPFSGAWLALQHELPHEIAHIIAVHSKEGDGSYRSPEAILIHHCDFIDFEIEMTKCKS